MTGRAFLKRVTHSSEDIVQVLLDLLGDVETKYCIVGGLAVNAYAEPVVSLDLDLVVAAEKVDALCRAARAKGMKVEAFPHSMNLSMASSELRIQVQTDPRYQAFLCRAEDREVLGYRMAVASARDVLRGKLWAYADDTRRASKRQKDLSDIMRLVETRPELKTELPPVIIRQIER